MFIYLLFVASRCARLATLSTASAGSQVRIVSRVGGFQSWIWGAPSRCRIFQLNSFHWDFSSFCLIVNFCSRSSSGLMLLFERARGREEIFSLVFEEGRSIPSCKVVFYSFYGIKLCYQSVCVPHRPIFTPGHATHTETYRSAIDVSPQRPQECVCVCFDCVILVDSFSATDVQFQSWLSCLYDERFILQMDDQLQFVCLFHFSSDGRSTLILV